MDVDDVFSPQERTNEQNHNCPAEHRSLMAFTHHRWKYISVDMCKVKLAPPYSSKSIDSV